MSRSLFIPSGVKTRCSRWCCFQAVAVSSGTLPTHNAMFIFLLIFVVLLVGALSFFPALSLGPVAEYFEMIA